MGKNLHQGSRTGVIFIEYKKGDKEDIANHLSISLLNLDYKIYTAVLKNRMQETLNAIIGKENQLLSKTILYFTHILPYASDISNTLMKQLAVIFCHRVDRDFTFSALHMFAYGNKLIHMIHVCYTNIQSTIEINSLLSDSLRVEFIELSPLNVVIY